MEVATQHPAAYRALADVLHYPAGGTRQTLDEVLALLRPDFPEAAEHIDAFITETADFRIEDLQEAYGRAFDISPQCVPYLSVFLFGEESFKRAELMTGLKEAYERANLDCAPELPDHIAVVLRYSEAFEPEEWSELITFCLPGPLKAMVAGLTDSASPYRHVLLAVRDVLKAQYPREFKSC